VKVPLACLALYTYTNTHAQKHTCTYHQNDNCDGGKSGAFSMHAIPQISLMRTLQLKMHKVSVVFCTYLH